MARPSLVRVLCCLFGVVAVWSTSGCGGNPSYRKDQLAGSVEQICRDEYHYTVSARLDGHTLAVLLQQDDVLEDAGGPPGGSGQVQLSEGANEILGNVIEVLHRVLLSSDAPIQFYVLLVHDSSIPTLYLSLVRYVDDVRRSNAQMLAPTEFFQRTLLDLKAVNGQPVALSNVPARDIQLEEFLSWQLAKRIQGRLAEQLARRGGPALDVGLCEGRYQNGEFTFALNVASGSDAPLEEAKLQDVFQEATGVIAEVLSNYRFDRFTAVRLIHPPTGRTMLLPKTRLEIFR